MPDHWAEAHKAALGHIIACWEAEFDEDENIENPASAPYCGCETCVVREVLYAAYPHLEKHFKENNDDVHGV